MDKGQLWFLCLSICKHHFIYKVYQKTNIKRTEEAKKKIEYFRNKE